MKVEIDAGRCCGAGLCVLSAPDVFDQDDAEGTVQLIDAEPPETLHAVVREAAEFCPNEVITVHER